MENLEAMIECLEKTTGKERIEKKLQDILDAFLRNYYIEFGTFKIDPVLVEAYYHNEDCFLDTAVHAARKERGKIENWIACNPISRLSRTLTKGDFPLSFLWYCFFCSRLCATHSGCSAPNPVQRDWQGGYRRSLRYRIEMVQVSC